MNETISIGIVGTGFARSTQIPAFRALPGARLVAIASGRFANAARVAGEFDIPHAVTHWRDVVDRDDIDLVSIVSPPVTHREIALAAIDAGKAVLCEKPMAMTAAESFEMTRRAGERGVMALIDHELRFLPARRRMRAMIAAGEIGPIRHVNVLMRRDSRAGADRPWDWWSDSAAGGGDLGAVGSHAIDAVHYLTGSHVSHVTCSLASHVRERPDAGGRKRAVTTDDEASLLIRIEDGPFTEGATGTISTSAVEPGAPEHSVEIFGERGALRTNETGGLWHATTGSGRWRPIEIEPLDIFPGMPDNEWSRGFILFSAELIESLLAGRTTVPDAATFADGHRTQCVIDAARESSAGGCRVVVSFGC
jgi:predicted dehydrogenase